MNKYKLRVIEKLDRRTALEQLAEEASELAQAALKVIRAEGLSKNPTPEKKALSNLVEEAGDVLMVMELLGLVPSNTTEDNPKWRRWSDRLDNESKRNN